MKKIKPFATEVALCSHFLAEVGTEWTPYAETAGWDILLVRNVDGFQIGIEAKLRLNPEVLAQSLEEYSHYSAEHSGPDCRAILVPFDDSMGGLGRVAKYIGITVIRVSAPSNDKRSRGWSHTKAFEPPLPVIGKNYHSDDWYEWAPTKRHRLPDYVPDVAAGSPSPIQLTDWKIAAMKIAITIERRGFVTRSDFKAYAIDHRRWLAAETKWLKAVDGKYIAGDHFPNFKAQHPKVYDQIAADSSKWMAA